MRLLVLAHKPPPHHGQSYMVQLFLKVLGGDVRQKEPGAEASAIEAGAAGNGLLMCYHVDCRVSDSIEDVGRVRWGKLARLLGYCAQALWCRFRYGVRDLYYIPAPPGIRSAMYRDWVVMALCRPFFGRVIFHWHGVGLGAWLQEQAWPLERWLTRRLLSRADLSLILAEAYAGDVKFFHPKKIAVVPNGIPDPCPQFETAVRPRRRARASVRAKLLAGVAPTAEELAGAGERPELFRIFYVGLCTREKGLFDLVEAVATLRQKLISGGCPVGILLTVAGKFWHGWEQREFETRIAQPDLRVPGAPDHAQAAVEYRGYISEAEKQRLSAASDCFCFPTYYPIEAQPSTLLEAMAFGLPIVTTRWRAIPELFTQDYPGLVDPQAPDQVARVLEQCLREERVRGCRERFLEYYTEGRWMERIKTALNTLEPRPAATAPVVMRA